MSFRTGKDLIEYLKLHSVDRDRLSDFYVIHGEEKWSEILSNLDVIGGPLTGPF